VLLGLVHGPTELLPVSSSAHTALLPRLLRWPAEELPADLQTSFEVALHGGAAVGLLHALRHELRRDGRSPVARQALVLAAAIAPPAAVGYLLEDRLEHLLGDPGAVALGLLGGGLAMAVADMRAPHTRLAYGAEVGDGVYLGLAQVLALLPGVSRNGATLTVARARGFGRADAQTLSWRVGLPVIVGAALLKGWRATRQPLPPGAALPFAAGALASLSSTLACASLLAPERRGRALWPFALYRAGVATLALNRR
jgi:undecaprenyl-diphosphatase